MGLSVAASSAILFVGFMFVATALFVGLNSTLHDIEEAFNDSYDMKMDFAETDIHVDNATNNTTHVFINITNRGVNALKVSDMIILINGSQATAFITNSSVNGNNATDIWAPEEVLYIEAAFVSSGGERVKVIAYNGSCDVEVVT